MGDLNLWKTYFASASGALADGDEDGDADGADFLLWQRNLGAGRVLSSSTAAMIAEPTTAPLARVAVLFTMLKSR